MGIETIEVPNLAQLDLRQSPGPSPDDPDQGETTLLIDSTSGHESLIEQLKSQIDPAHHRVIILSKLENTGSMSVDTGFKVVNRYISHARNFSNVLNVLSALTGADVKHHEDRDETIFSSSIAREEAIRQGRYLLVAEDNEINQEVILNQMELLGIACDIAVNGEEAFELWKENRSRYQLILTDLHMPVMDGYELVSNIRQQESAGEHIPIIALTADATRGEKKLYFPGDERLSVKTGFTGSTQQGAGDLVEI